MPEKNSQQLRKLRQPALRRSAFGIDGFHIHTLQAAPSKKMVSPPEFYHFHLQIQQEQLPHEIPEAYAAGCVRHAKIEMLR